MVRKDVLLRRTNIKKKYFFTQVFYFTHLLYIPYYVLLILHAPDFWKWAIGPLFLYILERLYRFLSLFVGHGYSHIVDADVLPSR